MGIEPPCRALPGHHLRALPFPKRQGTNAFGKSNALEKNLPAALQSFNRLFAGDDELLEFDLKESLDFNGRGNGDFD